MKKCPECGNPSYDGAPVCGNCGYKFPRQQPKNIKSINIFDEQSKKPSRTKGNLKKRTEPSTIEILKENKVIIGIILLITIIAICGIVISGTSNNNSNSQSVSSTGAELAIFNESGFSFQYPSTWQEIENSDENHETAIFFDAGNNTVVEYYNITTDSTSLRDINQERISVAQSDGHYIDTLRTITLDGRNASDMIIENADGDYTRYVCLFSDGELFVYRIMGDSINSVNSTAINEAIQTSHIG